MLLVITYSTAARASLRNIHRSHEESVVRWFGRSALFEATELGAFLALRLREKHPDAVQIERTRPFNEFEEVPKRVREAVRSYEDREHVCTPYSAFAAGTDHPNVETMAEREL
jgi:hypothetical protein